MKLIKTFENYMEDPRIMSIHKEMDHEMTHQPSGIDHDDHHEVENYMFFGNLETIHRLIGIMLQMDPRKVDAVLKNGHGWAVDHISTSKDDVEEVANFLIGEMTEPGVNESEMNYQCNECGNMYEAQECNEEKTCSCGGKLTESWA